MKLKVRRLYPGLRKPKQIKVKVGSENETSQSQGLTARRHSQRLKIGCGRYRLLFASLPTALG